MKHIIKILILFLFANIGFAQAPQWKIYNTGNSGLPSNSISCIAIDTNNIKWIGTRKLTKFDGINWTVYDTSNSPLKDFAVRQIGVDKHNNKWLCTVGGGLVKFDGTNWTTFDNSNSPLPSNYVFTVAFEGNTIWAGTLEGLVKIDGTNWTIYDTTNSGLHFHWIHTLCIENHIKWVGISSRGVYKFNDTTWTLYNSSTSKLPYNDVLDIELDNNSNKWFGINYAGLAEFNSSQNQWRTFNLQKSGIPGNSVFSLAIDSNNTKWIATPAWGMLKFYNDTGWVVYNEQNSPLPSVFTNVIELDSSNNVWIGTENGLAVFNENGIVSVSNQNNIVPDDFVLHQNYPNPFNPYTNIEYELKTSGYIRIEVFDMKGSKIHTLVDSKHKAGNFEVNFNSSGLPSGIYFYALSVDGAIRQTRKMVLLK